MINIQKATSISRRVGIEDSQPANIRYCTVSGPCINILSRRVSLICATAHSADVKDSVVYAHLLARIVPAHADLAALAEPDLRRRAAKVRPSVRVLRVRPRNAPH